MKRTALSWCLSLACALLGTAPAAAQPPLASLVKDINTTAGGEVQSSSPHLLAAVGNKVVFRASESSSGAEIWASDGTSAGTELLRDTAPGPGSPSFTTFLGVARGLFFWLTTEDGIRQTGLWRTDGTRAGTFDLLEKGDVPSETGSAVIAGDRVYFVGCRNLDCSLWTADGSPAGTREVPGSSKIGVPSLLPAGHRVFFQAGFALWVSDGSAAGTRLAKELPIESFPSQLTVAGDRLFFLAAVNHAQQLWTSDGTPAGTIALTHLTNTFAWKIWPSGDGVYFAVRNGAQDALWSSDGTPAGTRRVLEEMPKAPGSEPHLWLAGNRPVLFGPDSTGKERLWGASGGKAVPLTPPSLEFEFGSPLVPMAGHVAFLAADEAHGREPWISDGTVEGTHLLKDTCRGGCGVGNLWFQAAGAHLYFVIENSALWRSDGTEAGTEQLPTPSFVEIFDEWEVLELGGKLFVSSLTVYGNELWVHGEDGESRLVADLSRGAPSSSPQSLTAQGGRLFFTACDGTGRGLWQSPASGLDASPLPAGASSPCRFDDMPSRLVAGNVLYVSRNDPNRHPQLWRSDGTGAGTFQLTDAPYGIMAGDDRNPGQWNMAPLQGKLIFGVSRSTPSGHEELWESDGTVQGTRKASYLPDRNDYLFLRAAGNEVYFFTFDQNIAELWRSDGTAAGTRKLANASPPREEPQFLWAGNLVYFLAWAPGVNAMQIWRTDGTAAGTRTLLDGNHGSSDSYVPSLTAFQGNLIAFTEDAQGNEVLWRSDGTAAGTVPLRSFPYPRHAVRPAHTFAAAAGKLFFNQLDDEHGAELWVTDGTAQGTSLFKDVHPGPRSSNPVWLTAAGNRLFFSAHDGEHGIELWSSDGTAAGTRMVQDIAAEGLSASPAELTAVGDRLFFSADDGATGRELWSLPLTGAGGCQASSSRLCLNHGRYQVEASWRTADGAQGRGTAVPLSADTGYFWFFSASNLEVIVKVLDGQGVNGHVWVFYGALSDVEYTLTVTDTQTGLTRQYFNPRGQLASVGDTQGFGPLGAFSTSPGASAASATPPPLIAQRTGQATAAPCQASAQTLCLNEDRFTVDVSWKDFQGNTGKGTAVPLTGDTGTFWFFNSANTELVIKILDGRPVNNKFWLFYGALSNVEYTLRVTDTQTGKMRTYTNPSGRFASVADTDAF